MKKVIEFGYSAKGSKERLQELMQDKNTVLVDIRKKPRCPWEPAFNRKSLAEDYRGQYLWLGDELGNENYRPEDRHKGIKLINPDAGVARLMKGFEKGFTLLLLCGCKNYEECHRHVVVDELSKKVPGLEVIHPESKEDEPGQVIKCLSIREPYASWIANPDWFIKAGLPPKTIENREWSTRYRGPVLLHASATFEENAMGWAMWMPGLEQAVPTAKSEYAKSAIVGVADLVDCVDDSDDPWFLGTYGFVFANARPIGPIPYKGALKLFDVPLSVVSGQIQRNLATTRF